MAAGSCCSGQGLSVLRHQPVAECPVAVAENRHRRRHAKESELAIKALAAGIGVEDDLPMAVGHVAQSGDDRAAEPLALPFGMHDDVADIGAVDPVGERAAGSDQPAAFAQEAAIAAVREGGPEPVRRLVAERSDPIELGKLVPVDLVEIVQPFHRRAFAL